MTHAAPPPANGDEMVVALVRAYCANLNERAPLGGSPAWSRAAELVQAWIAYERERAIEEAAQCCDVLGEKERHNTWEMTTRACADAIRALKVIP